MPASGTVDDRNNTPTKCLLSAHDDSAPPHGTTDIRFPRLEVRHIGEDHGRSHPSVEPGRRVRAPQTIAWPYASGIVLYHLLALLAAVPWFFTWGGVTLALAGLFVFGTLGINLGYHRLLTHRGLICPKWLERTFVVLGVCCVQDTPARWVSVHRLHHQYSDEPGDPHSPLGSFVWGHISWLMVEASELAKLRIYERYAKDILADRFYRSLERRWRWVYIGTCFVGRVFRRRLRWRQRGGRRRAGGVACGRQLSRLGRFSAYRSGVAHHLVGEFPGSCLGLSTLRHRQLQPEQSFCRLHQQW